MNKRKKRAKETKREREGEKGEEEKGAWVENGKVEHWQRPPASFGVRGSSDLA